MPNGLLSPRRGRPHSTTRQDTSYPSLRPPSSFPFHPFFPFYPFFYAGDGVLAVAIGKGGRRGGTAGIATFHKKRSPARWQGFFPVITGLRAPDVRGGT